MVNFERRSITPNKQRDKDGALECNAGLDYRRIQWLT
jgi:hypothetical protein